MRNKLIVLLTLMFCLSSCNSTFVPIAELPSNVKELSIKNYDLFTFQMVVENDIKERPKSEKYFTNSVLAKDKFIVYEELYLLLHKKKKEVLYLTTLSHKYIYDCGVFNRKENDSIIRFDEIEYLYEGIDDTVNERFVFTNQAHKYLKTLFINYKKENDIITFTKVTNVHPKRKVRKEKPLVILDELYSVPLQFKRDGRKFVFKDKIKNKLIDLEVVYHDKTDIYFKLKNKQFKKIKDNKERVWYSIED